MVTGNADQLAVIVYIQCLQEKMVCTHMYNNDLVRFANSKYHFDSPQLLSITHSKATGQRGSACRHVFIGPGKTARYGICCSTQDSSAASSFLQMCHV